MRRLSPTCLPARRAGSWICSSSTSQLGKFSGQYQFDLSDEQDISGWAGGQTLTLNVTAEVVPEPSALALVAVAGLIALVAHCARTKGRGMPQTVG